MEEMRNPRPAHLLKRGAYDAPREIVAARHAGAPAAVPDGQPRNRLGLARWLTDRAESARRTRRRQSHLADALRPRHRRDAGGLRQPGPPADASRAARLARGAVHGQRLGREGAAPADRHVRDVSAVVVRLARARGARSGQSAAGARAEAAAARRGDPRQRARGERPAEPHDRRPERQAVSARGPLGASRARARPTSRTPAPASTAAASTRSGGARRRRRRCSRSTRCRARSAPRSARSRRRRCSRWCC